MEVKPFCYLKQTTTERNPPHGWSVHFTDGEVPLFAAPQPDMQETVERLRQEAERAWREVDAIAKERDDHLRWRQDLADQLGEVEKHRDAIAVALHKRENDLMALRNATDAMMASLGYHGSIDSRHELVHWVMDCLAKTDTTPARKT